MNEKIKNTVKLLTMVSIMALMGNYGDAQNNTTKEDDVI
jgi:hypothetical protein